jgi:hypothetical protein
VIVTFTPVFNFFQVLRSERDTEGGLVPDLARRQGVGLLGHAVNKEGGVTLYTCKYLYKNGEDALVAG